MSDSCCCHGHCCGLDATRLHFVLHRLNPFTYLYRLPSGQGEGGGMGTVTVPAFLPSPEDDGQKLRKAFQVMLWTMDPAERDAKLVNKALKRKGERHLWVIIEVACASSPDHLIAVRQAYCSLFSSSIEEDVAHKITPTEPLGQLFVRLLTSYRYPGEHVAVELAKHEAAQLFDAVQKKQLHRDEVIRVLSTRNKSQLKETFEQYNEGYGRHIEEVGTADAA
ncbi:hypothetical protein BHE74_00057960 [Ensete ventricosum]|nr:hypothetical protein BHE74_00057960 [Ensete ventricosum]